MCFSHRKGTGALGLHMFAYLTVSRKHGKISKVRGRELLFAIAKASGHSAIPNQGPGLLTYLEKLILPVSTQKNANCQALVSHTYSPSYLGGWDWRDCSLRPASANSLWGSISKIPRAKWTGGVAQEVQCLLCKHKVPSSNPSPTKNFFKNANWFQMSVHSSKTM
jgi:hypothetical protein